MEILRSFLSCGTTLPNICKHEEQESYMELQQCLIHDVQDSDIMRTNSPSSERFHYCDEISNKTIFIFQLILIKYHKRKEKQNG